MGFWHIVRVVKHRKWLILGFVAVTLIVILVAAPKPKVVYEASAYMSPTPQVMQGGVTTTNKDQTTNAKPDREVILSNLIILARQGEVYDKARSFLEQEPDAQKAQIREFVGQDVPDTELPVVPRGPITKIELEPGKPLTIQGWTDVLDVAPVQNMNVGETGTTTDIIRITIRMRDGEVAPYLANAVAIAFAKTYQEKSRADARTYAAFLRSSKLEAKEKLDELRRGIADYKRAHGITSVDSETQIAISSIGDLEATKNEAESAAREAQAALRDIDSQLVMQPIVSRQFLPADMNPEVKALREQLAQAETELKLLGLRYKPAHDTYKAAQAKVVVLKERIAKAGSTYDSPVINDLHIDLSKKRSAALYSLATARARSAAASASIAAAQAKAKKLAQAQPELVELMTEYAQSENTYRTLSEKYDQVIIAEQEFTQTGSIVPYGWAHVISSPLRVGPSRKQLLALGLVLSLAFAIVLVVWLDSIDNKMRNASDVEKLLELPVIGLTPQLTGNDGSLPRLTHLYPLSAMAESYRILRTNILFTLRDNPFKTLMVATGRPGQGATTTICNLAIALAQAGKKIILIDADMRRPSLHGFFDVSNNAGLSTLLQGEGALTDAFQQTGIENLIVIPAGPQPTNPSELLGGERMHDLVSRLKEHCDLVLFDTPSTVVFSDGPMLASQVDAVVMVVSANQVPRGTETQTRDLLRRAKANIIGVVVNRMSADNVDSCYFYSAYYSDSIPKLNSGNGNGGAGSKPQFGAKNAIPSVASAAKPDSDDAKSTSSDSPFPE